MLRMTRAQAVARNCGGLAGSAVEIGSFATTFLGPLLSRRLSRSTYGYAELNYRSFGKGRQKGAALVADLATNMGNDALFSDELWVCWHRGCEGPLCASCGRA